MERPPRETEYTRDLYSAQWDTANAPPTRWRYAIFASQRTGSEYLCALLRRRGLGVPCEYLHDNALFDIGARLQCYAPTGALDRDRYWDRLERQRTTPNGIFGTKLQPEQLAAFFDGDWHAAEMLLQRLDRVMILTRRDRTLQAISLARAALTAQWHQIPGDPRRSVQLGDGRMFAAIELAESAIAESDAAIERLAGKLAPDRVGTVAYEDLIQERTAQAAIDWLAGPEAAPATTTRATHWLPLQGDTAEALGIKERYLAWKAAR